MSTPVLGRRRHRGRLVSSRLAFTLRFADLRFITTSAITDESRVIIHNALRERLTAAAPFLRFDGDPYMVIAGGRLFWIADAYTTTDRVPYSTPNGGLNYIRNAVKVAVDAFNGTMTFYVFDGEDPLLRTYERMFPGMFRPAAAMPEALRRHVRYPEDLFRVQAQQFETYHVTDPGLLYNKGNQWAIRTTWPSRVGSMSAYYAIMRLRARPARSSCSSCPSCPTTAPT